MLRDSQRILDTFRVWTPEMGMERGLFQMMCLVCAAISLFVIIPANLLQNLPPVVNIAVFIFGVSSFVLYLLALRGRESYGVMYAVTLTVLNVTWFFNGGSYGSVIYYFFSAFIFTIAFFDGKLCRLLMSLLLADGFLLIMLERAFPAAVTPFASASDRFIDIVTGFLSSGVTCILLVWAIVAAYQREKEMLVTLNRELEQRLSEIKTLRGLLPICAWCKKVRDDEGLWNEIESYIEAHTEADFSHSICPECHDKVTREVAAARGVRRW